MLSTFSRYLRGCVSMYDTKPPGEYIIFFQVLSSHVQLSTGKSSNARADIVYLGPIRTSEKVVYLDKFSVIANTSH